MAIFALWEVEIQASADDLVILIRENSEEVLSHTLQEVLDTVYIWYETEKMSVNPHKTVIVPFVRKRKLDNSEPPSVSDETVPLVEKVKYLGISLGK